MVVAEWLRASASADTTTGLEGEGVARFFLELLSFVAVMASRLVVAVAAAAAP